jgi:hypothetical protein
MTAARPFLVAALARGRHARGNPATEPVLDAVITNTAVMLVAESVAALQVTYKANPDQLIDFKLRKSAVLFIEAEHFNNTSAGRGYSTYAYTALGARKSYGLLPARSRVTLKVDTAKRKLVLCYQPDVVHALNHLPGLTRAAARKFQIAVLPGGLHFVPAQRGTPAHYTVCRRPVDGCDGPQIFVTDPGSRVFGTMMHANKVTFFESNDQHAPAIMRAKLRLSDRLKGLAAQTCGRFATHLRRRAQTQRDQLKNFVTNGHRTLGDFLVQHANLVIWPHLSVQELSARSRDDGPRKLTKMATRVLQTWRHYDFRMHALASKLRFHPKCCVLDADEKYTSKGLAGRVRAVRLPCLVPSSRVGPPFRAGCNRCLLTHETLGGAEVFKCPTPAIQAGTTAWLPAGRRACGTIVPRDANATCGILARTLVAALDPDMLERKAWYLDEPVP